MYTPRTGNMFANPADYTFVTTNSFVKKSGELVMGRGAAAQAVRLHPDLPAYYGRVITMRHGHDYGILVGHHSNIGLFQVKRFWGDDALPALITLSADLLAAYALRNPDLLFNLNYPGIGNGRLPKSEVEPLLACLPSNVHIWTWS